MSADYTGTPFRRPTDRLFYRVVGRFIPEPPNDQVVYSYSNLREYVRLKHCLISIPVAAATYGLLWWTISQWGYLALSPALLIFSIGVWAFHQGWLWLTGTILLYFVVSNVAGRVIQSHESEDVWGARSSIGKTPGFLGGSAVFEEQWFREGSENWTWIERLRSNIVFGLVHIPTLIYPFAWIAVIPFGGMALTWAYLKQFEKTGSRCKAVREVAVYHWVFNMIMVAFFVGFLVYTIAKKLIGLF